MRVGITGATGFIGGHLVRGLEGQGDDYVVVTRNETKGRQRFPLAADVIGWDPPRRGPEPRKLEGLDAVVHLAGEPVSQRWTKARKNAIFESRVPTTRLLAEALAALDARPQVLVSNSAIGFYGPSDDTRLNETAPPGSDFLADVGRQWESAAQPASEKGIRVVHPRVGIVLGPDGGALSLMLTPFKLGVGGPIGAGSQWMSWIHVEDVVGLILHAIVTPSITGAINVTAPEPVRNKEFSRTLGKVLHRPALIPIPVFALKLIYGEFADILASGQRVVPDKALAHGYTFRYPDLTAALRAAVTRGHAGT